jgi:hypothetical protein
MNVEQLIREIRDRALSEPTRTDSGESPGKLFDVVDPSVISETEAALGFELPKLLATLYLQVGNGGFGPGFGIFGLRDGHTDANGRTLLEIYPEVQEGVAWYLKSTSRKFLPICDWGCGIQSCLDCESADVRVLTFDERGFTRTHFTFESWLRLWSGGNSIFSEIYEIKEVRGINPFTREPMIFRSSAAAKGERMTS